jgi:hypothetical protein
MPLEGLWWMEKMNRSFLDHRDDWKWTAMILLPDFISAEMVQRAAEILRGKKNPAALSRLRFAKYDEGSAAQILYIGPFADEGPTIAAIHDFIAKKGRKPIGKHHEIYLSDPRRTAPEKLKTIIRQPMR